MAEQAAGLGFAMPTLQYNDEGWGPYEISDTFRDMPYQVMGEKKKNTHTSKPLKTYFAHPMTRMNLINSPENDCNGSCDVAFFDFVIFRLLG